jgi:demethylmenaquinone methyltransferase/2-methoxy-6-polyprenyl-1,4-benzoquinol methylase
MARVLRPGGRLMVLEFTPLRNPVLRWSYHYYFTRVLPVVGGVIARRLDAYRYLARSVEVFPDCEEFKALMEDAGLRSVTYRRLSMGIAAVHLGTRP